MKALPKRKGNRTNFANTIAFKLGLNESPSEKEGKCACCAFIIQALFGLNESPSEKEGKYTIHTATPRPWVPQ